MKKYVAILFFLLPYVAQAQLSAESPDVIKPTQWLTGNPEQVFVFFDKTSATLTARDTGSVASTFTWLWLDQASQTYTEPKKELGVTASSLTVTAAGGYQVRVVNALRDTAFSCWVFFDDFKIDTIEASEGIENCNALRLEMRTTPHLLYPYTIYNFEAFLNPPHVGDSSFMGVQEVSWEAIEGIHVGVDNPDVSWKSRQTPYTIIDSPPPLYTSSYTVEVTDVFGKRASYTTPYAVTAVAVYLKAEVEKEDDPVAKTWTDAGTAFSGEPLQLEGEALLRLRFSHGGSINATQYIWKGFANATSQNSDRTLVWTDTLTVAGTTTVSPRMPHKGQTVDGYTPGTYTVRLVVSNGHGCADSAEVKIAVKPSSLDTEAIPNAFTPNGDNLNDTFRFVTGKQPVSMEYIRVYVYNRSGGLVYRYEGEAALWKGWDGRFMGTGNDMAEGVYFYIINGEGWDGVRHNTSEYKGSVHLFR
jgi:gliding motility-associated-like protein